MNARQYAEMLLAKKILHTKIPGYIGQGTDRIVFDYSKSIAIKIAKTSRGYKQNIVESIISDDININRRGSAKHFAKVLDTIEDDGGVKALIVRKIPFRTRAKPPIRFLKHIANILSNYNFKGSPYSNDIDRHSSWRKTGSGRFVMVDYGFNSYSAGTSKRIV